MINISHLKAEYLGPDILIGSEYSKKHVLLLCTYDNGSQVTISSTDFHLNDTVIHYKGENTFYAIHRGVRAKFTVNGVSSYTNLIGNRTKLDIMTNGDAFETRPHISKSQLDTYLHKYDGTVRKLNDSEYEIIKNEPPYDSFSTYYKLDDNGNAKTYSDYDEYSHIDIRYGDHRDSIVSKIKIPVKPKFHWIFAWYEGFPLNNTNQFRPVNMIIIMQSDSGRKLRIPHDFPGIKFSITDNGDYTSTIIVSYQRDSKSEILSHSIIIPMVEPKEEPEDQEFNVMFGEDDVTETFQTRLAYNDSVIINWNTFMNTCKDNEYSGVFKVTAPKKTGLDNRFATVWEVICDGKTLKASIIKIYDEPIGGNYG